VGRRTVSAERGADNLLRRTRAAVVGVVLAGAGLIVSLVAGAASAWPQLAPELLGPPAEPEPRPAIVRVERERPETQRAEPSRAEAQRAGPSRADAPPEVREASRPASPPQRLLVPAVGIDSPVRPVGVADDGQMQLPIDPAVVGWYRYGPAPADRGSAVLAAHVDSWEHGLGPLARLRDVAVGDTLVVRTARGSVVHTVTAVTSYAKQALPRTVFARSGPPRLRVITCGGAFDEASGHYEENLVVTAEPRPTAG
jgi:Sortase domain